MQLILLIPSGGVKDATDVTVEIFVIVPAVVFPKFTSAVLAGNGDVVELKPIEICTVLVLDAVGRTPIFCVKDASIKPVTSPMKLITLAVASAFDCRHVAGADHGPKLATPATNSMSL